MPWKESSLTTICLFLSATAACTWAAESGSSTDGDDWFQFLGPNRNAVSEGPRLAASWDAGGPPVVWRTNCLVGFSGPIVKNDILVLMERGPRPEPMPGPAATSDAETNSVAKLPEETVRGMDAKTGAELWRRSYPCEFAGGNWYWGPCATPTGVKDRVVCQFIDGKLRCFALKTGNVLWERDLAADFGMTRDGSQAIYQACSSPLIAGDQVVVMVCTQVIGLLSLSIADGKEVWRTAPFANYGSSTGFARMGHTNVVIAVPSDVDRRLFKNGDVLGFHALTGRLLWHAAADKNYYNCPPPIANEDILIVEGGGGDGPTFAFRPPESGEGTATILWKDPQHQVRFSNYLIYRGLVFGQGYPAHGGPVKRYCIDSKDGKLCWERKLTGTRETHHSMFASDGKVLQLHENGELSMFDAAVRDGYRELARARVVAQKKMVWSFPALVRGSLYVRTDSEVVCLDLTEKR
ncbi:MAG: PQQ-binding-like beta-propeller repeat protein [Thermoguttaceae bacterium]